MTDPVNRPAVITPNACAMVCLALCLLLIGSPLLASNPGLTHEMSVVIDPDSGVITVEDEIRTDRETSELEFVLNAGLAVETGSGHIETLNTSADGLRKTYRVILETPGSVLKLHYRGQPRFSSRRSMGGMPQGTVSPEAVYLDRASAWYPLFERNFDALILRVKLPDLWQSVSIGRRTGHDGDVTWTTQRPHDELYLIAGRFARHARKYGDIDLSVYLLDDDPGLATRYLDLIGGYLDHYSDLIGDYPYAKFAVVENRWQTGYGMPSFTLLGSRVIRLPFIPYTSLPHEILHNWWGNGVWVDYRRGNWSEGLTAYLADHWMKERTGKGDQYRLKALQRYSNFAGQGRDMPLLDFVSRHGDASQSIGYSKSLMVFHMLRRALGDAEFTAGLQRLWERHRFTQVGFAQVIDTIAATDAQLATRLMPWLKRTGAPRLRLETAAVDTTADGFRLHLAVRQVQDLPFHFDLPIAVSLEGEEHARVHRVRLDNAENRFAFDFPRRPLRIDIDPHFDVLRYLDPSEQPPALNRLFGGNSWLIVPKQAPPAMREAWVALAEHWKKRYPGLQTIADNKADSLPREANRIVLGWDNRLFDSVTGLFRRDDQQLQQGRAVIRDQVYEAADRSVVLVSNDVAGISTAFVGAGSPQAIQTLARKLTHYGSYGRLVFDAENGGNLLKGSLSSPHSQLSRQLSDQAIPLKTKPLPALHAG